jgi:hypothetical protein
VRSRTIVPCTRSISDSQQIDAMSCAPSAELTAKSRLKLHVRPLSKAVTVGRGALYAPIFAIYVITNSRDTAVISVYGFMYAVRGTTLSFGVAVCEALWLRALGAWSGGGDCIFQNVVAAESLLLTALPWPIRRPDPHTSVAPSVVILQHSSALRRDSTSCHHWR